jgi:hypothetical protein
VVATTAGHQRVASGLGVSEAGAEQEAGETRGGARRVAFRSQSRQRPGPVTGDWSCCGLRGG